MFVLDCMIKIANYTFKQVHDVQIVHSVDLLSDTAVIKIPASAVLGNNDNSFEKKQLENEIQAGNPVEITLAYKNVFEKKEFTGYVASVKPNTPTLVIECEDAIYNIRKYKRIHKNFGKTTLKKVLAHIIEDTGVTLADNIPDMPLDNFLVKDKNGAQALQLIKDKYFLNVFIDDDNKLFAGLRQTNNKGKRVLYNLHKNVVKHDLKYRKAEDINLYVKLIGVKKDNTKVEVVVGEPNGEQITEHVYNVSDIDTLKAMGKSILASKKFNGYSGTITSFLVPEARRGMGAEIFDDNFSNRSGTYFIPKVTTTFGPKGARRQVELGSKLV